MLILVTGATGKVGRHFIARFLADERFAAARVRALCHNRVLEATDRIEVARGSIADRATVDAAMDGVTHVLHLATCKETPDDVMDVTVKGMFWLLEAFRTSKAAQQFILIGGDAAVGHFFYDHGGAVTEATPHSAYPGCYALSKVLEEVMLQQYCIQYDINGCCLRAPVDHGEGRLQIHPLLRRRRFRRAGVEGRGSARPRRNLSPERDSPGPARREEPSAEAKFRACGRPRDGDPRGDR